LRQKTSGYIGFGWQEAGAQRIVFAEGKAAGTKAILAENACGLSLSLLEDRALDIYSLKVKGFNVPFLSKCGPVHPAYYDASEWEWLRSFSVGFLTTCGLTQAGEPCRYNGSLWGLHGPVSNTPAENVRIDSDNEEIRISGAVRQYKFQMEDLLLERTVTIKKYRNELTVSDRIANEGWKKAPFMLLYHYNFGYPMLNENTWLELPPSDTEAWDEYSGSVMQDYLKMEGPDANYREQTFVHSPKTRGRTGFMIANDRKDPKVAAFFEYDCTHLPLVTQWKHFKPDEYVMAVEPCNNHVKGALWETQNGTLQEILPGEVRETAVSIRFIEGKGRIITALEELRTMWG
jgi:hypothetical protein